MGKMIGRLNAFGFGIEGTPGASVGPQVWYEKESGDMSPEATFAEYLAGAGRIEGKADKQLVKLLANYVIPGTITQTDFGWILKLLFGTETLCQLITISGQAGGSPARNDAITSATGSFVGTIKKLLRIGATTFYLVSTTSGTLTNGATNLTNGTWTGGTVGLDGGAKVHLFQMLNTNAHPTATLYDDNPIQSYKSVYGMLNALTLDLAIEDFAKFEASFKGLRPATVAAQSPSVASTEKNMLAKFGAVYMETAFTGLEGATAKTMQTFSASFNKNVRDIAAFGSVDAVAMANRQFACEGEFEAIYEAATFYDLMAASTKQALRFQLSNTDLSTLQTAVYPSLFIDFPSCALEFERSDDTDELISQTISFDPVYDKATGMMAEAVLLNSRATAYAAA